MSHTSRNVLLAAERMETAARDLYVRLAGVVDHGAELRKLFRRLAAEEAQHALHLRLQAQLDHGRAWPPSQADGLVARIDRITAGIRLQEEEFADVRSLADPVRLLARLAAMESGFDGVHAGELAVTSCVPVRHVFTALSLQDGVHRELLALASRRLRGPVPPATHRPGVPAPVA